MSPDCPECGDPLVEAINYDDDETVFTCIQCGYSAPAEEAPAPTGSPLDVRARNDEVQVEVPDPRRHRDTRPLRLSPDGARRLAEALEQGADDAERRGGGDSDGGGRPDRPPRPEGGST